MNSRNLFPLLLSLLFASPGGAESFSGSIAFGPNAAFSGEIWFTALDPGETSSSFGPFSTYTQTADPDDYTYLYYLQNDSTAGTPTSFCNEHCFYGLDLETVLDPTTSDIHTIGFASNGGEEPSFIATLSPDLISYEFDDPPNYGIVPEGGFSAWLRFYSPFGPSDLGGAFITQNTAPPDDFVHLTTGVTTPVPEPGSAALLGLGLAVLAARRRP